MSGVSPPTSLIPEARDDDDDDVAWALQTAAVQWKLGGRNEAVEWLRRAAEAAAEASAYSRARELNAAATALEHAASLCADEDDEDYDGAEPILEIGEEPMVEPMARPARGDGRPELPTLVEDEDQSGLPSSGGRPGLGLAVLNPPPKIRAPAQHRRPPPVRRAESKSRAPSRAPSLQPEKRSPRTGTLLGPGPGIQSTAKDSRPVAPPAPGRSSPPGSGRLGRASSLPPLTKRGGVAVEAGPQATSQTERPRAAWSFRPDAEAFDQPTSRAPPSRPLVEATQDRPSGEAERREPAEPISVDLDSLRPEEDESAELLDLEDAEELPVGMPEHAARGVQPGVSPDLAPKPSVSEGSASEGADRSALLPESVTSRVPPSDRPMAGSGQPLEPTGRGAAPRLAAVTLRPEEPRLVPQDAEPRPGEAAAPSPSKSSDQPSPPSSGEPVSAPMVREIPSWAAVEGSEPPTLTRYRRTSKQPPDEPSGSQVGGIALADVRGLQDLPEDIQRGLALKARLQTLDKGEEVAFFAVALVVRGWVEIMPAIMDTACARASKGEVVFTTGTLEEGLDLSVRAGEAKTVVAVWDRAAFDGATADCPWVADELRLVADGLQALAGASVGPLGERLDETLRAMVTARCEVRTLRAGEVMVELGNQVRSMHIVGAGRVELLAETGEVDSELGPGDFLFAAQVLSAGPAPRTARVGKSGAVVLMADRKVAHELMVSVPPLLELLADV